LVGEDLAVWGGAARVYLPGAGTDSGPYRHFLIPRAVVARDPDAAGRIVADRLAISIAARRAPREYEPVRRALAGGESARTVEELETMYLDALEETERLRRDMKAADEERLIAVLELEDAQRDLDRQAREIAYLRTRWSGDDIAVDTSTPLPESADAPSDAVRLAREHLTMIAIPDRASEHVGELDGFPESGVWGSQCWWALRALHLYAIAAKDYSGFWNWCETSGDAFAWRATPKKLAMSESDYVMNALSDTRRFEVDARVSSSCTIIMEAHIKISEGGGPNIPRIYFHDDTKGATRKVHVGFIGPHKYVPNASSN
jgi:hypothetical protein